MSDKPSFILEGYDPAKTYFQQKKFDCENDVINRFVASGLKKQVRDNLSKCFVLLDQDTSDKFVGFYTLTSFAIDAPLLESISKGRLPNKVPCTRMVMLGVDKAYQKQNLGLKLLVNAIDRTISASQHIGVLGLYLDADPPAVGFYLAHGFVALKDRHNEQSTPMFLHIETAKAAL
ncbi:MAG: N-acetyltransferase [Gammaproteobacteria bacterium]|nr:MAG: N-acetyltransferase [Gammaproteobacteria bacterium]